MLEKIIGAVCDYSNEKIKITKGAAVVAALCAFVVGLVTGIVAARIVLGKKAVVCSSSDDDFDADEYVKNLNFDEE